MHATQYDATLGTAWKVSMRIDDIMYDAAMHQHDTDSQDSIITLFRRECMLKYHDRPDTFNWDDSDFMLTAAGTVRPHAINRVSHGRRSEPARYGCTCKRTPVECGLCSAGHHRFCKFNCEFGNLVR